MSSLLGLVLLRWFGLGYSLEGVGGLVSLKVGNARSFSEEGEVLHCVRMQVFGRAVLLKADVLTTIPL
jgi:hypothetical protein